MHGNGGAVVHLAFPLNGRSMCPWYGPLMTLTAGHINWLFRQMALAGRLEDEVDGLSQLTYDRTPPICWLPGNGFISGGRGGAPFFVHPDWVHRRRNRLIPGHNIPLQLHVAPGHVFLSGDWWTTQVAAESERAPYTQIQQCLLAVATPLEFPFVFSYVAALDPWTAVEVLERGGLKALGGVIEVPVEHLEANDLRELLNSGESAIRQRASSWLSQAGDRAVASSSTDDTQLSSER